MSSIDDKFTYTWSSVAEDLISTDQQTGWGVNTTTQYNISIPDNSLDALTQSFQSLPSSANSLKNNALRATFGSLSTAAAVMDPLALGKDISSLTSAAVGASVDYLQDKWRDFLEKYIFSTTPVSVKALLEDIGALTISASNNDKLKKAYGYTSTESLFDKVVSKLDTLTAQFLGIEPGEDWGDLAENLFTDYANNLSNNDKLLNTVASMQTVKGYVETLQGVMDGVQDIVDILKKLEPAMPFVEIAVAWAGVLFNPTSATEATNKTLALAQELLDRALQHSIVFFKKYLFSIEIDLPTILVSSANTLNLNNSFGFSSLEDMVSTYADYKNLNKLSEISNLLGTDSYISLEDKNVQEAIKWLENSKVSAREWQNFDFNGSAAGTGLWKKRNYLSQGVDNIMTSIANRAASIAGSQNIEFIYDDVNNETKIRVNGEMRSLDDYYFPRNTAGISEVDETYQTEASIAASSKDELQRVLTDTDIINISGKILSNI